MALTPGTRLAEYEIVAAIGAGGMGEVYRARDTKLGREVAIKILPDAFSRDEERVARFEREARLLASLNHPGIAILHGFEKHDDVRFLVMELVEGATLEARIEQGPIPIDEAIPLFEQMAEALEAAHDKGVIHRDLKPANVKLTSDGRPKILDFGLAMSDATQTLESNVSESPTVTRGTSAGVILGTAPYMSPEQARGKSLDKRTDIWSFGCVLYEALTARRAFDGDTLADILGAIVKTEPDWKALPETTPGRVRALLRRCLAKDLRRRLRDMGEAWVALDDAFEDAPGAIEPRRSKAIPMTALVALVAVGVALLGRTRWSTPPSRPITITEVSLPPDTELAPGWGWSSAVAISPDARHVAYIVKRGETRELYLRAMNQIDARLVDKGADAHMPFFSPDGEWLGFYSNAEQALMRVSVSGGAAVAITEMQAPRGASWGSDGHIVVSPFSNLGLARVSANGGEVEVLTSPDREQHEKAHRFPDILPGGEAVVFMLAKADIETFDDAPIAALSLETGEYKVILEGGQSPLYSRSGHLVYARAGSLLAVPFDPAELRVTGTPVPVLDDVSMVPAGGMADYSLSRDGTLLYAPEGAGLGSSRIVWVDRQGRSQPLLDAPRFYGGPRLSPDGSRLAFHTNDATTPVWVYDFARSITARVVIGWDNRVSQWAPDGKHITYMSNRSGVHNLYQTLADGSGPSEWLSPSEHMQVAPSWSSDGTVLVFGELVGNFDLWTLSMDGERREREIFLQTEFNETQARFSPDGRWIAYHSDESGRLEVYIRPFPRAAGKLQVSTGGGMRPAWNPNGREIFYRNGDAMMVVDVAGSEQLTLGKPRKLFDWPRGGIRDWDVAPDGQRFVMVEPGESVPAPTRLYLITNWSEELKRLVPRND